MSDRSTDPAAVESRGRLLDAAEDLFSAQGLDGPSARAIAAAAGHANTAAVSYHFGDRMGLVTAVVERWTHQLDIERNALLSALEMNPPVAPRAAVRALLLPWIMALRDPQGRRRFRILNQAGNHPLYWSQFRPDSSAAVARSAIHILPLIEHLEPRIRRHRARTAIMATIAVLNLQTTDPNAAAFADSTDGDAELLDELVELVVAILSAPAGTSA